MNAEDEEILKSLSQCSTEVVSSKFDLNLRDDASYTILQRASKEGLIDVVRKLLDTGDCNRNTKIGALHVACKMGHIDIVKLLVEHDSEMIDAWEDFKSYSAIEYAV